MQLVVFGGVAIIFLAGFLLWVDAASKTILRAQDKSQAFATAEAGIEYYRWHLAHNPNDFKDNSSSTGPYVHNYYDKTGNLIGQFSLNITPPAIGSTVVTIQSTGSVADDPTVSKIIQVKMGIPSFAKYAVALNDVIRFGQGTEVFGPIHSNYGIRFDGLTHNLITSAVSSYNDPDHSGGNELGVHTHVIQGDGVDDNFRPLEAASSTIQNRPDVFMAGRQFPVPAMDFTGITQNLSRMQTDSLSSDGFHASSSGAYGYEVILRTDQTFDLYKITSLVSPSSTCTNYLSEDGWGTWSIKNKTFLGNKNMPTNGIMFFNDNVWVSGQINNSRVTVASGVFPDNASTRTSITVNSNLLYTNYDGSDVLSLIAQKNINIGMVSADNIRIDAALMAQNGRVGRYYYRPPNFYNNGCSPYDTRNFLISYGMIASNKRYGFAWTDGTGYITRNITYDSNLLYGPPPEFPLTTDSYQTISWDEIK